MKSKWIITISAGVVVLVVLAGLMGSGVYRRLSVSYHYRRMVSAGWSAPKHLKAITKYPDLAFELAREELAREGLSQEFPEEPEVCVWILAEIGDSRSIALLSRFLNSDLETEMTEICVYALDRIRTPEAKSALLQALDNKNQSVRKAVYTLFLRYGANDNLAAVLRKGLRDESDSVKKTVLSHLERLPQQQPAVKNQVRAIFESAGDGTDLKTAAARVLAMQCDKAATAFLMKDAEKWLKAGQPLSAKDGLVLPAKACGKEIAPHLIKLLREVPGKDNWPILDALGEIAGKKFYERAEAEAWWREQESEEK